ncbi:MAG: PilZ domain-containing protein [Candidatus Aminicenantes bacterium]|nr:PilZ domain-containing protein [Candidatus Aminicenantes bacterium]
MTEKRREKRVEEEAKVSIRILKESEHDTEGNIVYALTKDISSGGAKILTDKMLPVNTLLEIELTLPKMRKIVAVTGKVRWVKQIYDDDVFETGLQFVDTAPESIMLLLEYIYSSKAESRTKK